jgi:hypothetical protein
MRGENRLMQPDSHADFETQPRPVPAQNLLPVDSFSRSEYPGFLDSDSWKEQQP